MDLKVRSNDTNPKRKRGKDLPTSLALRVGVVLGRERYNACLLLLSTGFRFLEQLGPKLLPLWIARLSPDQFIGIQGGFFEVLLLRVEDGQGPEEFCRIGFRQFEGPF